MRPVPQRRTHTELLTQEQAQWQKLSVRLPEAQRPPAESLIQTAARLATADATLRALGGRLDRMLDMRVGDVQSGLGSERDKARAYRDSLRALADGSAQLGGEVLGGVGAQAAQRFAEVLVRADAGVVDAAWARKVKSSDNVAQLVGDQKREIRILDEEFDPSGELLGAAKAAAKAAAQPQPADAATPADTPATANRPAAPPPAAASIASPAKPVPLPLGLSEEAAADYLRYLEAGQSYRTTVEEFAKEAYPRRRAQLAERYVAQIKVAEREEQLRRAQALTQFEDFLVRYPRHPRYTPRRCSASPSCTSSARAKSSSPRSSSRAAVTTGWGCPTTSAASSCIGGSCATTRPTATATGRTTCSATVWARWARKPSRARRSSAWSATTSTRRWIHRR